MDLTLVGSEALAFASEALLFSKSTMHHGTMQVYYLLWLQDSTG